MQATKETFVLPQTMSRWDCQSGAAEDNSGTKFSKLNKVV